MPSKHSSRSSGSDESKKQRQRLLEEDALRMSINVDDDRYVQASSYFSAQSLRVGSFETLVTTVNSPTSRSSGSRHSSGSRSANSFASPPHSQTSGSSRRSGSRRGEESESLLPSLSSDHVTISMDGGTSSELSNNSSSGSEVKVILLSSSVKKSESIKDKSSKHSKSSKSSKSSAQKSMAESIKSDFSKSNSGSGSREKSKRKSSSAKNESVRNKPLKRESFKSATGGMPRSGSSNTSRSNNSDDNMPAQPLVRSKSMDMINMLQKSPYASNLLGDDDVTSEPVRRTKSLDLGNLLQSYRNQAETLSSHSKNGGTTPRRLTERGKVKGIESSSQLNKTRSSKASDEKSNSADSRATSSEDSILGRYVEGMGSTFSRADYSRTGTSAEEASSNPSKSSLDSDTSLSSDDETLNVIPVAVPEDEGPTRAEEWQKFLHDADDYVRRKLQYAYMIYTLYAVPILVAYFSPKKYVSLVYFWSLGCIAFVNGWMLTEAVSAFYYTKKQRDLHHSSPEIIGEKRLGAIISAYLPNELSVLIETVRAVMKQIETLPETATLDIVVSHNGGSRDQRLQFLASIRKIEKEIPERVLVHELNVVSSKSKAENVNAGLMFFELLTVKRGQSFTELAMYDADHQPIPEAFLFALETMQDQKCDMVMGRCCVQDGFKFIAVEFDILYSVAHAGGRMVRGFGFFGGSNGYWDYVTLQETGMDEGMLTEDVDSSFRAQAAGHRMTYDPTIVSYEEAPPSLLALFKQRLRWSQGWGEVTVRQKTLWFRPAPGLTLWSRFCIFLLLPFRELYAYFSSFTVPIAIVYLSRLCGVACIDYRLIGFLAFCAQVPVFMTWSAWYLTKDRVTGIHYRMPTMIRKDYYIYIILSYAYEFAKVHTSVLGHARNFLGLNAWVVTKRKSTKGDDDEDEDDDASVIEEVDRPEELIEKSPYAPPVRRLFAGIFDAREYQAPGPPGHALEGWPGKDMDRTDNYDDTDDESASSASSFSIERVSI